ncbi:hypothetical protein DL93DRAFT_2078424 [Clavulina sp. PMI_390]|nr:hypothetical protein DL93DRAFT_2078424 [Clavulina sp. PMI_390]
MRAATSIALIALLAAPAFASPLTTEEPPVEEPTTSTTSSSSSGLGSAVISSAAGGAAGAVVSNLLDKELEARAPLSATGLGGSLLSSAAGGAASGLVGNLLSEVESLFRRGVTDVHDEELYVKRDVSSISSIIKQAQTLSASDKATVKNALMTKIGTLQTPSKRLSGSGAVGTALGGLASVGANSVVSGLLSSIESLFKRDEFELEARAPLSATSFGGSLLSSAAGGAASGAVGNLLGEIEKLFRRDDFELEARAPLSSTSLGGSLLSSAAGGAASGLVGNLLGEIENLFRRGVTDVHDEDLYVKRDVGSISTIIKQAQTLSASDKATVKTALMNKIGTLQTPSKRLSGSGAVGTALGGLASVGANSVVSGLLTSIENLFRREEEVAKLARREATMMKLHAMQRRAPLSATSFGGSLLSSAAGGAASGAVGNLLGEIEKLFRREEFELEARAGLGGAIASSVAGGAASGLVGNLLGEIESLFRRSDEFEINDLD